MQAEVTVHHRRRTADISARYNMASIAAFAATGRRADGGVFRKVAVQFPDDLLPEAVEVMAAIQSKAAAVRASQPQSEIASVPLDFISLADNTFGACCPDEVTAKHYNADAIVHLGYACFSRSSEMPVFNDTPSWEPNWEAVRDTLRGSFSAMDASRGEGAAAEDPEAGSDQVVLLFHPGVHDVVSRATAALSEGVFANPAAELSTSGSYAEVKAAFADRERHVVISEAVALPPSSATREDLLSTSPTEWCVNGATFPRNTRQRFVFVGPTDAPQLHQLSMVATYNASLGGVDAAEAIAVVATSGAEPIPDGVEGGLEESLRVVRQRVRQRMFNIEHVKAASVVGIVVASLGITNFRETAEHLRALLIRAGKRAYIIYIGHLNQFKLANFVDSVDCFCVIACPNSRIAHFSAKADGILKPLVSPAEVAIALGLSDFMSPAAFTTQFDRVLAVQSTGDTEQQRDGDDGAGDGTLITTRPLNVAVAGTSAIERLHERHYVGLEPKVGETAVQAELVAGRAGIAKGYAAEESAQGTKAGAKH